MLTCITGLIILQMGKRKPPNIRVSYPDTPISESSTAIRIYRTNTGRLGNQVHIQQSLNMPIQYGPPAERVVTTDTPGQSQDDERGDPWTDSFFADNEAASGMNQDTDETFNTVNSTMATISTTTFLDDYIAYRQSILNELIQQDGRLGSRLCFSCAAEDGLYRCQDCFYCGLFCKQCIVSAHLRSPFHRILVGSCPLLPNTRLHNI